MVRSAKVVLSGAIETLQRQRGTGWGSADLLAFVFKSPQELRAALEAAHSLITFLIEIDP